MFYIAKSFLTHKKKTSFFLLLILSLSLALMFLIIPMLNTIIDSYKEAYQKQYGKFHLLVQDIKAADMQELLASVDGAEAGWVRDFGLWEIGGSESEIRLAYFDETAYDLSSVSLKEGRLPATANEIVLEDATKY
ncbi:MAG: hypothetical protein ACOX3W_04125 [Christensenellaceae bacterium]|jgi:hypothetical protein